VLKCTITEHGERCHDSFSNLATVVCYMLGFGHGVVVSDNRYGVGSGQIWLDDVRCSGTETSIADCRHNGWGSHNCGHYEDVSVLCSIGPTVRLDGGDSSREGRLEVYHNGIWGTVCDDGFSDYEAIVVCYMLGHGNRHIGQFIGNRYGAGNGPIWLDDVQCSGTEIHIESCQHRHWGSHNCRHYQDVSVSCFNEVRLVGDSGSKGRLEVYHNGMWGTVCNVGFTDAAAGVVCYSLGFGHSGRFIANQFGAGSGQIWLDNVLCNGSESHITDCQHNGWGRHSCRHSDDVSVSCIADSAEAVALVGGGNPRVGRLEVFHGTQWGTVCDDGFTDTAARVVCYSLGFGYIGKKVDIDLYGVGDGLIWLTNISCIGTEQHIGECSHGEWRVHNCRHHEDVAISCIDNSSSANANDSATSVTEVRLAGGWGSKGRLVVLHDGVWGTVCGDYFSTVAASVVCKMLSLGPGSKIDNRNYTTDHGPIWLDNVRCNGTEMNIAECSHDGWGVHNCEHHEDVAVACTGSKVEVRLNGGRDPREGRLEVFYDGVWGTVCTDGFNYAAARVVCSMLGFGYIGRPTSNNYRYGPIWLTSVRCNGTEKSISECVHDGWGVINCSLDEEQAVSCLTDDAVALFAGGSPREGRLEVYRNGTWGTVCDDGFTDEAARVICYSLGFGYIGREIKINIYGSGRGKIWLDDIHCDGTERHIGECQHSGWGVHNCGHYEDVAVSCVGDSSPATRPISTSSPTRAVTSTTSTSMSRTPSTSPLTSTVSSTTSTSFSTSGTTSTSFSLSSTTSTSTICSATSTSSLKSGTTSTTAVGFTMSIPSDSIHDVSDTKTIITAVVVVGGLLLIVGIIIICIVAVVACKFLGSEAQVRWRSRRESTETVEIPMHANTFTNRCYNKDVVDVAAIDENPAAGIQASNNVYSELQQPFAPIAGAVGGAGGEDVSSEPFAKY